MTTSAAPRLRERSATEIIDVSIQLFRQHYATFVMFMVLSAFPSWLVLWLSGFYSLFGGGRVVGPGLGFNPSAFGLVIVTFPWAIVLQCAIIVGASDAYITGTIEPGRAIRIAFSKTFQLIGAYIVLGFLFAVAALPTLFIGSFYLALRYFAVAPALLIENQSFANAFHRSRDLSQGFKWRILGTMALSWVIMVAALFAIEIVLAFIPQVSLVARALINAVVQTLVQPLLTIVLTVLYYDQRVRKDGFDLEVATRNLEAAPAAG